MKKTIIVFMLVLVLGLMTSCAVIGEKQFPVPDIAPGSHKSYMSVLKVVDEPIIAIYKVGDEVNLYDIEKFKDDFGTIIVLDSSQASVEIANLENPVILILEYESGSKYKLYLADDFMSLVKQTSTTEKMLRPYYFLARDLESYQELVNFYK